MHLRRRFCKQFYLVILAFLQSTCGTVRDASPGRLDQGLSQAEFQQLVLSVSENPGYFDTDNLITNEDSFQHVVPELVERRGTAYIGVGPDQNFTYIAAEQPTIAFIVDLRRGNLLLIQYLQSLIEQASDRWGYLSRLLGIPLPENLKRRPDATASELVSVLSQLDKDSAYFQSQLDQTWKWMRKQTPLLISEEDRATVWRLALPFYQQGFDLRFRSLGRRPRPQYPSLGELLLQTDRSGRRHHYLERESDFQFLKRMCRLRRIVPITGDLSGGKSLKSIGTFLIHEDLKVSAVYVSNVEYYLFRDRRFGWFVANLRSLPRTEDSILIRSYFGYPGRHPKAVPGYAVTSLTEPINHLLEEYDRFPFRSYWDLIFRETPDK